MGCFNTKGFFSGLDISGEDKAFVLLGVYYQDSPIEFFRNKEVDVYKSVKTTPSGVIYPISFPIFGDYDWYGGIENINRDGNVKRIEKVFGDPIETILNVIKNVRAENYIEKSDVDRYLRYKEKINLHINVELVLTMDHSWVYETLGKIYLEEVKKSFDGKNLSWGTTYGFLGTDYRRIYSEEDLLQSFQSEFLEYLSFQKYLNYNNQVITESSWTGQDVDWDKIEVYAEEYLKFVKGKC